MAARQNPPNLSAIRAQKGGVALSPEIHINISEIAKSDATYLARQTLRAVGRYFAQPGVREAYEKWLEERKRRERSEYRDEN